MSNLMLDVDQAGELKAAFRRGGWTNSEIKQACQGRFLSDVRGILLGKARIVTLKTDDTSETVIIDPIVRIDRSVRPVYPDFLDQEYLNKPEFIALEKLGPPEFDASRLRKWWHPKQKRKVIKGTVIHNFLVEKMMLPSCLGFVELLGIQAKGIEFFHRHFKGQVVFGWRSVVPFCGGDLRAPYLVEDDGEMVLYWRWLGGDFDATYPALRFAR
ncbi:MAG: hypothetical protein HYV67_04150 [Candidatus Taylorbacteria bacterium]|nr:hypothetical protein [Candidatus Taylorbacteria bacterium]